MFFDASVDFDEVEEDILQLSNNDLRNETQRYLVHMPEFDQESGEWVQSRIFGFWYLSPAAFGRVRPGVRAEKKASWDYWQSRIALLIGLLGALIGVLAYLKK